MMKKFLTYCMSLCVIALLFQSCKGEDKQEQQTVENPKIGFLLADVDADRWSKEKALLKEEIAALGGELFTEIAQGDHNVQMTQAEKMINEYNVNVLVIVPVNRENAAKIVTKAHEKGVKVIAYDRMIASNDLDYYISFDSEKVGRLQAEYVSSKVSKGRFMLFGGDPFDDNAYLIEKGQKSILNKADEETGVEIVFDNYTENWNPGEARAHLEGFYKENNNEKVQAVLAANDNIAGALISYLEKIDKLKDIVVVGQDADSLACLRILEGKQQMTVYKPSKKIAQKTAELAVKLAKGEEIQGTTEYFNGKEKIPSILIDPQVVDKSNIWETIFKDGHIALIPGYDAPMSETADTVSTEK